MNEELTAIHTRQIKAEALRLGFSACGVSPATAVDSLHGDAFRQWLEEGHQAGMDYMARHMEKRLDPRLLVDGAQSIVSVALNYYPALPPDDGGYQLAWYAYGEDYHTVMKDKLHALLHYVATLLPGVSGRAFCDTAPLLERYWAWRGGLGWTIRISISSSSPERLGLLPGRTRHRPPTGLRHTPTRPLRQLHTLPPGMPHRRAPRPSPARRRRCLSYLTIEHRGPIPPEAAAHLSPCIYGCDRCQEACPWNRFAGLPANPACTPARPSSPCAAPTGKSSARRTTARCSKARP